MNDKYIKKVRLIYGLGYIKDPCVPQTLWFLGIYLLLKTNSNYSLKGSLALQVPMGCGSGGWGLNDWGLQMRGGLSSLGELANSSMSSSVSVLWKMYRFSLWSYWVFLIATIKSSPPPSAWVLHSGSWSISLWDFPLSLLLFLPPVFTDSNYYAQLSIPNFCLRTLGSSW